MQLKYIVTSDLASLVAQTIKIPPAMQETWVRSLGGEDPLEEGMATHSSILAWRIPWTEEPGGLQSMGLQEVLATEWLSLLPLIIGSRVGLFPFPWGPFLALWQFMSQPQSSHHVADFFHLVGVSVSLRQLTGYGSEYYLQPLRRN